MNYRRIFTLIIVSIICVCETSCIRELGITFPSINKKKKIRKIGPPYDFTHQLFNYRNDKGYWPKSEFDFSKYDGKVVEDIYKRGFESWSLGQFSEDTLLVYWIHAPIVDGTHVGIIPIPDKKIYLVSTYIFRNRGVDTDVITRKKYNKLTGKNNSL